jgi:hypothetical protein
MSKNRAVAKKSRYLELAALFNRIAEDLTDLGDGIFLGTIY